MYVQSRKASGSPQKAPGIMANVSPRKASSNNTSNVDGIVKGRIASLLSRDGLRSLANLPVAEAETSRGFRPGVTKRPGKKVRFTIVPIYQLY